MARKAGQDPLVHLIDGPVWVFRAYYSLPSMTSPDGRPTNAAYGYANTLLKYLVDHEPTHVAVAFDVAQDSFRNEEFPEYKAQRDEIPEDLDPQWEMCTEITRALGISVGEAPGFEADDVLATWTAQALKRGANARVVTTDKDMAQLVREDGRVALWDMAKDHEVDADGVREKFGVDPDQIPDYLGLIGDTVDNLPGVPGVGPKGASAALRAFGRIEDIPADPAKWEGLKLRGAKRVATLVEQHRELALETRRLATLIHDVPAAQVGLRDLQWRPPSHTMAEELFESLGWDRIATRIPRPR